MLIILLISLLRIKFLISFYKRGNVKILIVLLIFPAYHDSYAKGQFLPFSKNQQKFIMTGQGRKERPEGMSLTDTWPQTHCLRAMNSPRELSEKEQATI